MMLIVLMMLLHQGLRPRHIVVLLVEHHALHSNQRLTKRVPLSTIKIDGMNVADPIVRIIKGLNKHRDMHSC